MSNGSASVNRGGMGCLSFFVVLLQVLFIGLKLTNQIDWGWLVVFMPFLVYFGVIAMMLFAAILALIVIAVLDSK